MDARGALNRPRLNIASFHVTMKNPKLWSKFLELFPKVVATNPRYNSLARYLEQNIGPDVPNILLYGPQGFPINLLWNVVATNKFGKFSKKECIFEKTVCYLETTYFIEIDFLHPANMKALDLLNDLIKTIITASCIYNDRHIIVCHNIDNISDIFTFRVLLERYSKNAFFVCTTHSLSSIEAPLKSRFFSIRVPLFTEPEIGQILSTLDPNFVATKSNLTTRNIFKAIAVVDCPSNDVGLYHYPDIQEFFSKARTILQTREFANKVYCHNVPFPLVVQDILRHIPGPRKPQFVATAADIEHMMVQTNAGRQPIYYERLFAVAILQKQ